MSGNYILKRGILCHATQLDMEPDPQINAGSPKTCVEKESGIINRDLSHITCVYCGRLISNRI